MKETRAGRVLRFIDDYILVPEGKYVGQPIKLDKFQRKFIIDVYDNPHGTRTAILSLARKNGKTALIACLVLAHLIGPERMTNAQLASGALSRDQAALVFNLCEKMLRIQPKFDGLYRVVPSSKRLIGLKANTEFKALSADGSKNQGHSPLLVILDEVGQVRGPTSSFIEAMLTASGAHDNPLTIMISTQAASDADFLSLQIDDAISSGDPHTVCHVYQADKDCDLLDKKQWKKANPALGTFRSEKDLEEQLKKASRIPALENSSRNLLLNQRIALISMWLSPTVWKSNNGPIDMSIFTDGRPVAMGLDLSQTNDLTAAVLAAQDDDEVLHLIPFCFTPEKGLDEKEIRDRAPYTTWVKNGQLVAVPGATVDYKYVFDWLRIHFDALGINVDVIAYDRWRIKQAKSDAESVDFYAAEWVEVGQGYKDASPRIEFFEKMLLQEKIRHGSHPLLNMAAANAIAITDPAGNRKLDKSKSTQRIDPLVAAVMATGVFMIAPNEFDVAALIG